MEITISPRKIGGMLTMIASKSRAHRLLIAAALGKTPIQIKCNASSADIDATVRCLSALGAQIEKVEDGFRITPGASACAPMLDCGESGSTLRFLLPVIGALGKNVRIKLSGRLPERPLSPLWEELEAHGMRLSWEERDILSCQGQLRGGAFTLPGNVSSQFISGLLFAMPLLKENSTLSIQGNVESAQYIAMTEDALRTFGIQFTYAAKAYTVNGGQTYIYNEETPPEVEGDWSNAAFWLSVGALGGDIKLCGLKTDSLQGDKEICRILAAFGAEIYCEQNTVSARGGTLRGIAIDATQIPDLVPVLAVVAAGAKGETRIRGAERLRIKESDRLKTVCAMLGALGAQIQEMADGLLIKGGAPLCGGTVESFGDHRIAMAAAVASCISEKTVIIRGAEAVEKSYPDFWTHFEVLGGQIERRESEG